MRIGFGVCGLSLGVLLYLFSVVFFFYEAAVLW